MNKNFKTLDELPQVHALLSAELSQQWPLIAEKTPIDSVNLELLCNILNSLDYLLKVPESSRSVYQLCCKNLFDILGQLQLDVLIIEKIAARFGKDCYFIKTVLER